MIWKILLAFLLAIGIFAVIAALRPATYHVERTSTIAAPPAVVFGLVNDFHQWDAWSPWAKIDPAMKLDVSGPPAGVGATYVWSGNDKAGAGKMTIEQSDPDRKVGINLEFLKPFPSNCVIAFAMKPDGNGTAVTWAMDGENSFMLKAMSIFSSMDKMIGPDFEKGLAQLKTLAEKTRP